MRYHVIYFQCLCYLALPLCIVSMHLTRRVSLFPLLFNFLFLKLQFMRIKMYIYKLDKKIPTRQFYTIGKAENSDRLRNRQGKNVRGLLFNAAATVGRKKRDVQHNSTSASVRTDLLRSIEFSRCADDVLSRCQHCLLDCIAVFGELYISFSCHVACTWLVAAK